MSEGQVTIQTRNFLANPMLKRRQMSIDVAHPGRANVSKKELREKVAKMFKVKDPQCVLLYGFRTDFGGGRSSGFGLIYDTVESLKKYTPHYGLVRVGLATKIQTGRKQKKERKNRAKKLKGTKKNAKK